MPDRHPSMMEPPVENLLDRVDSKFTLVSLAAMRGRQINSYFNQLGEGLGTIVPPQVTSVSRKPLSISLEEIAAGKITYTRPNGDEEDERVDEDDHSEASHVTAADAGTAVDVLPPASELATEDRSELELTAGEPELELTAGEPELELTAGEPELELTAGEPELELAPATGLERDDREQLDELAETETTADSETEGGIDAVAPADAVAADAGTEEPAWASAHQPAPDSPPEPEARPEPEADR